MVDNIANNQPTIQYLLSFSDGQRESTIELERGVYLTIYDDHHIE
jgi:hypothetical protein